MEKFTVHYNAGQSRYGDKGVDYMLCRGEYDDDEFELYAEADPIGHYVYMPHLDEESYDDAGYYEFDASSASYKWRGEKERADVKSNGELLDFVNERYCLLHFPQKISPYEWTYDDEWGTWDELKKEILEQASDKGIPVELLDFGD